MAEEDSSKRRKTYVPASTSLGSGDSLLPGISDDVALICLARVSILDYPSLSCVNKKFNELIKGESLLAQRKQLKIAEYLVFMVCHSKDWVMFSPMQNKWLVLPKIPNDECLQNRVQASLAVDDELLVFREEVFKSTIWKFSLRSGCWVKCKDMHCPRRLFASASLGNIAIVAGGIDTKWNELASARLYDSSTGRWEMLPNMHTPRRDCSGFFMDSKFYVIGGISNCGEEFDLETKKWRKIEGMYPNVNRAMEHPRSFAVVNDELFTLEYHSFIVKKYHTTNNKWETMGRFLPMVDSIWGMDFKACGDQLMVFCKKAGSGNDESIVVYCWCPKSRVEDENFDLKVFGFKDNFDGFTVMGC